MLIPFRATVSNAAQVHVHTVVVGGIVLLRISCGFC